MHFRTLSALQAKPMLVFQLWVHLNFSILFPAALKHC
jgi:hypothetical protein